jgi:hypothetical protein
MFSYVLEMIFTASDFCMDSWDLSKIVYCFFTYIFAVKLYQLYTISSFWLTLKKSVCWGWRELPWLNKSNSSALVCISDTGCVIQCTFSLIRALKIGIVLVLHLNPWVEPSAGRLWVPKGFYSLVAKYFGTCLKIRIWINLSRKK